MRPTRPAVQGKTGKSEGLPVPEYHGRFVCLECFGDLAAPPRAITVRCTHCGATVDLRESTRTRSAVSEAVLYSYVYPAVLRRDARRGRHRRYSIGLSDVFLFIGLAAASGLIGQLTVDAAKALIRRVARGGRRVPVHVMGYYETKADAVVIARPGSVTTLTLTDADLQALFAGLALAIRGAGQPLDAKQREYLRVLVPKLRARYGDEFADLYEKGLRPPPLALSRRVQKKLGRAHAPKATQRVRRHKRRRNGRT